MPEFMTKPWKSREVWHLWFAWYPVPTYRYYDGSKKYVWLRKVLRREIVTVPLTNSFLCDWVYKDI